VYGIDFDPRAVKVSKALNLIAGDGKTNNYKANSLDSQSWEDDIKSTFKTFLSRFPNNQNEDDYNQRNYKYFDFDVVLSNPPFAGDITEKHILREYLLAEKDGKTVSKIDRDTLFIERNINFLKPGGRMALVLPQGKLNNAVEKYIREFILDRARILAVVSLDINTFKPHTGTKTSILFIQKWDNKLCRKKENYVIFFATSKRTGKNNSGHYIFLKDKYGNIMLDDHGHPIIDHDLDQISEEFIDFAKSEKLSFWRY
jgi:type I restriction enzyme M protein